MFTKIYIVSHASPSFCMGGAGVQRLNDSLSECMCAWMHYCLCYVAYIHTCMREERRDKINFSI